MLSTFRQTLPLDHELLGEDRNIQAELIPEEINQTLLVENQRHVIDGWTVVDIDHLTERF